MTLLPQLGLLALATLPQGVLDDLPARSPIAGMNGFQAVSRVVYPQRPDAPQRLEVRYQFPERVRWYMSHEGGTGRSRVVEYRLGGQGFQLLPGKEFSDALDGDELRKMFARMEVRRAAFLWPDGVAWEEAGGTKRRAPYEAGPPAAGSDDAPASGNGVPASLEALLGEDGLPSSVRVVDAFGQPLEELVIDSWLEDDGRRVPHELRFCYQGITIWREEVLDVSTDVWFLDVAFLPPDRRAATQVAGGAPTPVRAVDLVPQTLRRHPLPEGVSFEQAIARFEALAVQAADELGREVDPRPTLEIDAQGNPRACLVRLAVPADPVPEGWENLPERPGMLALVAPGSPPAVVAELLADLERRLPEGSAAGAAYVRVYEDGKGRRWELALPFVRSE